MSVDNKIRCTDGCKRALSPEEVEAAGWTYLCISNRWRCPACRTELAAVNEKYKEQDRKSEGEKE